MTNDKPNIRKIPVSKLTKGSYQRALNKTRVNRMIREYDPLIRRIPIVTDNGDGMFNVVDGQHTVSAEAALGFTSVWVEVKDIAGGVPQEAHVFVKTNTEQKRITKYDEYNACVIAGEEPYLSLHSLLASRGFKLSNSGSSTSVASVGGVLGIAQQYGPTVAAAGIFIAADAFGQESESYRQGIPQGISLVIGKNPDIDIERLIKVLQKMPRGRIINSADALRKPGVSNASQHARIAQVIVNLYNKGLHSAHRIEV